MRRLKQTSTLVVDFITNHKLGAGVSFVGGVIGIVTTFWGTDAPIIVDQDALQLSFSKPGLHVGEALTATLSSASNLQFNDLDCVWHLSPTGFMSVAEQDRSSDRCTAIIKSAPKPSRDLETMGSAGAHQVYTVEAVLKEGGSVLGRGIGSLKGINYLLPKAQITGAPLSKNSPVKIALTDSNNEGLDSTYTCEWPQFPPAFLFEADTSNSCSGVYSMPAGAQQSGGFDTMKVFQNVVFIDFEGRRVGASQFQIPIAR